MQHSVKQLGLVGLVTAVIVCGTVALAGPPTHPAGQDSPGAVAAQDGAAVEASAGPVVDVAVCSDQDGGLFGPEMGLSLPEPPQVGQPCCVTLCEAVCGVGEPCACKRCQVFGCGL